MKSYLQSFTLRTWHVIVSLVALQVIFAFLTNSFVLSFDESMWQYIGRNWFRHGFIPYSGGVDNKSPLIFMIYGLSDQLFGINYWFPRLLAIGAQTTGVFYLYKIGKNIAGRNTGLIAMTFYGLSLLWKSTNGKMISLTQTYEICFLIIGIYFVMNSNKRKQFFISGLFMGLAIMFRLTAAFTCVAIFVYLLSKKEFIKPVVFATGTVIIISAILLTYQLIGISLNDYFTYSIFENFTSGGVADHPLAWKAEQFANAFFYSEIILFYPFVISYFLLKEKTVIFIIWIAASFTAIVVIGMFAQSHLKELLPPLSLMSAVSVHYLVKNHHVGIRPMYLIILLVFFPKDFEPLIGLKNLITKRNIMEGSCNSALNENEEWNKKMGMWIRSHTKPNETVYVAGFGAQVQAYSWRLSPTIYFNLTQTSDAKKILFADLDKKKPAMIVIPIFSKYTRLTDSQIIQFVDNLVSRNYVFQQCVFNYNVYIRKK
jgi:hypothetical protein